MTILKFMMFAQISGNLSLVFLLLAVVYVYFPIGFPRLTILF